MARTRRWTLLCAWLVVAVSISALPHRDEAVPPGPVSHAREVVIADHDATAADWSARSEQAERAGQELLAAMNAERRRAGLAALEERVELQHVAQQRARDLGARDYFAHVSPDGVSAATLLFRDEVAFREAAENLVRAHAGLSPITLLLNSPGHRAHIMDPAFDAVGVGAFPAGERSFVIATVFADSY